METTTFDEDGDVALLLDQQPNQTYGKRFVVSSKVLSLASPVWKAMFSGKYREGAKSEDIPFPDDDPWALAFMLNLAHLRFASVTDPTPLEMVKIAVLCDKYDLVSLCRFHVDGWVRRHRPTVDGDPVRYTGIIFFAWVFGYAEWMRALSHNLIINRPILPEFITYPSQQQVLPPGLSDLIDKAVEDVMTRLLACAYRAYEQMARGQACKRRFNQTCNFYLLGAFTVAAGKLSIHFNLATGCAERKPGGESVSNLATWLRDINVDPISDGEGGGYGLIEYNNRHSNCHTLNDLKLDVLRVMDSVPDVLQDHHIEHMKIQAKKLGR
ncbi:hypothetical protein NA57DRAFT_77353 [Rhizodiscina lignyota]|uniref:BTB domain-containing protein n=1 Tax=Rhizodiscina lignyota TaxID=1504668 RepID=A0A9P4IBQ6_9PEZI|nr:hypothetical protein NA57DRAFT_77353 [Rhizodiscina lignyota]